MGEGRKKVFSIKPGNVTQYSCSNSNNDGYDDDSNTDADDHLGSV